MPRTYDRGHRVELWTIPEVGVLNEDTVSISTEVPSTPDEVWAALTVPSRAAQWFGTLSDGLRMGNRITLDFGDGDFSHLYMLIVKRPSLLEYGVRFLGIGPVGNVIWRIEATSSGTYVSVTDVLPDRSVDESMQAGEGWRDFIGRLARYLRTGERTRYDLRSTIDCSIDLPWSSYNQASAALLQFHTLPSWIPLQPASSVARNDETVLWLDDGLEPSRFEVEHIERQEDSSVSCRVRHNSWSTDTNVQILVKRVGLGSLLSVRHTGWRQVGLPVEAQRRLRQRFVALWIGCLKRAELALHSTRAS